MSNQSKILFLVQLPPPVHGASMMNSYLTGSELIASSFSCKTLALNYSRSVDDIGKFNFKKIILFSGHLFKLIYLLISYRPALVYFTVAPSGGAFYRDVIFRAVLKLSPAKKVLHLHGKGFAGRADKSKGYAALAQFMFKGSYTIHLTAGLAQDVSAKGIRQKYIVPNGIENYTPLGHTKKIRDRLQFLYLSNYIIEKGIVDLVDAIELLVRDYSDFHLNLVGKPFDLSIAQLENYIAQKNLSSFITVCGPRYGREKVEELENADIFIFPTYYPNEAFPLVLLEALQFGIPCISTQHAAIPEIINEGETGFLVQPRNIQSLAEKIRLLSLNEELRKQMSTKAKHLFREKYTLPVFEKKILEVFSNILRKP